MTQVCSRFGSDGFTELFDFLQKLSKQSEGQVGFRCFV
jgi:hypothetical protein